MSTTERLRALAERWDREREIVPRDAAAELRACAQELRAILDAAQDETAEGCRCGWGGTHDPDNPQCPANAPEGQPEGSERCHHCGSLPDADGDHSCPCPFTDSECLEHTLHPVTAPAPVPDEAVEALVSLIPDDLNVNPWVIAERILDAGYVSPDAHAASVRKVANRIAEVIAEAIEAQTDTELGCPCQCSREQQGRAARIAREAVQ